MNKIVSLIVHALNNFGNVKLFFPYFSELKKIEKNEKLAEDVAERNGSIDIWINNAGVGRSNPILEYTKEEYDYVMKINLEGMFEGCLDLNITINEDNCKNLIPEIPEYVHYDFVNNYF